MKIDYVALAKQIVMKKIDNTAYDIFLFGSRADGTAREMSDIDIGIKGKKQLDLITRALLDETFENSIIPYKIDIVDFSTASEKFKSYAMQHAVYWNRVSDNNC